MNASARPEPAVSASAARVSSWPLSSREWRRIQTIMYVTPATATRESTPSAVSRVLNESCDPTTVKITASDAHSAIARATPEPHGTQTPSAG